MQVVKILNRSVLVRTDLFDHRLFFNQKFEADDKIGKYLDRFFRPGEDENQRDTGTLVRLWNLCILYHIRHC